MGYNEAEDFAHHGREVSDFLQALERSGITVDSNGTVLDLGAGHGMHAGFLSEHFAHVHCADIVNYSSLYGGEFLKLLDEKHKRNASPFDLSKISFMQTDAQNLVYRDDLFDCVFTVNTFEHIPDPARALDEIIRVLRPGGYAYLSFDPIWTADTGSHFSHFVTEPWAHLVLTEEEFAGRMRQAGANPDQVLEFRTAMNRKSLAYFQNLFSQRERLQFEIKSFDSWRGIVHEEHAIHDNFRRAVELGYGEEELMVRGLRYVIRKAVA